MLAEWQSSWEHRAYVLVLLGLVWMLWMVRRQLQAARAGCARERRGREEMEAYVRLDARLWDDEDIPRLAGRICGVVASRSAFGRVAMLIRDPEDRHQLIASEGMDTATTAAVRNWINQEWRGVPVGTNSLVVCFDQMRRAIVVPIGTRGALLVCADSILQVPRRMAEEAVAGLEALAVKLRREMEGAESREFLNRAKAPESQYSAVSQLQERTCA